MHPEPEPVGQGGIQTHEIAAKPGVLGNALTGLEEAIEKHGATINALTDRLASLLNPNIAPDMAAAEEPHDSRSESTDRVVNAHERVERWTVALGRLLDRLEV